MDGQEVTVRDRLGAPGFRATREQVYQAIDSERAYQEVRWGGFRSGGKHEEITCWLVYMKDYVEEALHIMAREPDEQAVPKALDITRKVATLGVAAMEQLGAPRRQGF